MKKSRFPEDRIAYALKQAGRVTSTGGLLKFPDWTTKQPLAQAARQSSWLAKWLSSATGEPVSVLPVVALPGWFVDRTGQGPVRVFAGGELPQLLHSRGTTSLSTAQLQRVAHQLEQRVRTVAPQYRDDVSLPSKVVCLNRGAVEGKARSKSPHNQRDHFMHLSLAARLALATADKFNLPFDIPGDNVLEAPPVSLAKRDALRRPRTGNVAMVSVMSINDRFRSEPAFSRALDSVPLLSRRVTGRSMHDRHRSV